MGGKDDVAELDGLLGIGPEVVGVGLSPDHPDTPEAA
jgi:hypothetical protein